MARLLNANFARLFKSLLFWICAGISVALGLFEVIPQAIKLAGTEYPLCPERYLINPMNYISWFVMLIITAIFVGIFVGAEHGGVLRNKITAGHGRVSVYMADFLTCLSGVVIFKLLFIAAVLLTGIIMGGNIILPFETIAVYELLQFVTLFGVCALFTAITMLIPQKLAGAIAALILTVGLYIVDLYVDGALYPLHEKDYVFDEETGEVTEVERIYTDEELMQLNVLTILKRANPLGQDSITRQNYAETFYNAYDKLMGVEFEVRKIPPLPTETVPYSLAAVIFTTAVGTIVFRKKDLK